MGTNAGKWCLLHMIFGHRTHEFTATVPRPTQVQASQFPASAWREEAQEVSVLAEKLLVVHACWEIVEPFFFSSVAYGRLPRIRWLNPYACVSGQY